MAREVNPHEHLPPSAATAAVFHTYKRAIVEDAIERAGVLDGERPEEVDDAPSPLDFAFDGDTTITCERTADGWVVGVEATYETYRFTATVALTEDGVSDVYGVELFEC